MKTAVDFFKGVLIGAGCILPGVSSGVLCVIFGMYEKILDSIVNFFKDVKENAKFLLPIGIGGVVGIFIFSKILEYLLYMFPLQTKSIFIGLIIGGIPLIIKETNQKEEFKKSNIIYMIITLIIGIAVVYFENKININISGTISNLYLGISGFFMSLGLVVPGLSSTIILMLFGIYSTYLNSISSMYLPVLLPIGIGIVIGAIIFMKITKILLDKYYAKTMYCIIGFTLGSIFVLLPEISTIADCIVGLACVVLGYKGIANISKK